MKPDAAADIVRKLRAHGHEAYFVGGCVRDMLLKLEPADYDIATSARPEQVARLFPRTEPVGAKFGVVLVIFGGHPYEVATFRSDEAYIDGRRPTGVVYTDARQDVLRRDFTINGLLYDPITDRILDYVNGEEDLRAKLVRAIGDPKSRFEEDKLRVLRAVRFGARFGYTIEDRTWAAVCEMAPLIHQVSKERIREEVVRIMTEGDAAHGVRLLEESGLRREILPEVQWTPRLERELSMLRGNPRDDFAVAVLLHETPIADLTAIIERLKFSRAEMHHVVTLSESLPRFATVHQMSTSQLKRFLRQPRFDDHLELARIHFLAGDGDLRNYEFLRQKQSQWSESDIAPPLLISGDDLIALGFRPGPSFKTILTRLEDEQLEGRITSREEALEFARKQYEGMTE